MDWRDKVPKSDTTLEMKVRKVLEDMNVPFVSQFSLGIRDHPITVADFWIPPKTAILVDGKRWHSSKGAYRKREWQRGELKRLGIRLIEIKEEEIGKARETIEEALKK